MSACNVTKLKAWKNLRYENKKLINDKSFYRYQGVNGMSLQKGLALDLVNQKCVEQLNSLYVYQILLVYLINYRLCCFIKSQSLIILQMVRQY